VKNICDLTFLSYTQVEYKEAVAFLYSTSTILLEAGLVGVKLAP